MNQRFPVSEYRKALVASGDFPEVRKSYVPLLVIKVGESNRLEAIDTTHEQRPPSSLLKDVDDERIVLIGEPGAGKTWMIKNLILESPEDRLSAYLDLTLWEPCGAETFECLVNWVAGQVNALIGAESHVSSEDVLKAVEDGNIRLLAFDGLNELSETARSHFRAALRSFEMFLARRRPEGLKIVVGTRKYGFVEPPPDKYVVYEVVPPDKETKVKIFTRYSRSKRADIRDMSDRMQRLTDNILMLRIYSELPQRQREDITRAKLIEVWVSNCLAHGGIRGGTLGKADALTHLETIANLCHTLEDLSPKVDSQVIRCLRDLGLSHDEARRHLDSLLNTGLLRLKPGATNCISFAYQQVMEYFLACKAKPEILMDGEDYIKKPKNHEILALAGGLLEDWQVAELLKRIKKSLHHDSYLVLAAMVLSNSAARAMERQFGDALFSEIKAHAQSLRRLATAMLMCLGILWVPAFLVAAVFFEMFRSSLIPMLVVSASTLGWYVMMPRLFVNVYGEFLLRRLANSVTATGPAIEALILLRSVRVDNELAELSGKSLWVSQVGLLPDKDIAKIANKYRYQIEELIERAIEMSKRDLETILWELANNPLLLEFFLRKSPSDFTEREVNILCGVAEAKNKPFSIKVRKDAVKKLGDVAKAKWNLKKHITDRLKAIKKAAPQSLQEPLVAEIEKTLYRLRTRDPVHLRILRFLDWLATLPGLLPFIVGGVGSTIGARFGGNLAIAGGGLAGALFGAWCAYWIINRRNRGGR